VNVTYINAPRPLLLEQKSRNKKFWDWYYKPYQVIERTLGLRSDKLVLANSSFTANAIREQIGVNPLVIYPPVDVKGNAYSKSNGIKKNIVLTIARFSPEKKLERIPLIARRVNAKFVILGTVNSEASYRRVCRLIKKYGVEDKVTTIVNLPNNHEVKMELLRKAKVFLYTSLLEPFGISIVEGMGSGCIPVVHDSGGPREFVPYRWRYKDAEDASQKIKEALDSWSPSIAKDMRSIAYQFRKERFQNDFSRILKSYLIKNDVTHQLYERA
jgi:glycosyltransferase involved in cell wall biosynthesis